jgi:prepilin-type N-terminal cleavage/methylation domain-containing protein
MKRKGFTLVELLAVMGLLAIIVMISFPIVLSAVKKAKSGISTATKALLQSAVDSCISENKCTQCNNSPDSCTVTVSELITDKYITESMLGDTITKDYTVTVTKTNNKMTISDVSKESIQVVCAHSTSLSYPQDSTSPKVGKLFDKNDPYAVGTEYKCDPGDGKKRTFYVISSDDTKVNLIMAINYGGMVSQNDAVSSYLNALKSNKTWKYTNNISMPTAAVVAPLLGVTGFSTSANNPYTTSATYANVNLNCPVGSCTENVSTYQGKTGSVNCYWTATLYNDPNGMIENYYWLVSSNSLGYNDGSATDLCGFRPVITMQKTRFETIE